MLHIQLHVYCTACIVACDRFTLALLSYAMSVASIACFILFLLLLLLPLLLLLLLLLPLFLLLFVFIDPSRSADFDTSTLHAFVLTTSSSFFVSVTLQVVQKLIPQLPFLENLLDSLIAVSDQIELLLILGLGMNAQNERLVSNLLSIARDSTNWE